MDELLGEFITETNESIAELDNDIVTLEQTPDNPELLGRIFRTMHTIKGTCGFIGLPRLEKVAHAGENILGKIRDGDLNVTPGIITIILECLDTIKGILGHLENQNEEPEGDDTDLIDRLNKAAAGDLEESDTPEVASPEEEASASEEVLTSDPGDRPDSKAEQVLTSEETLSSTSPSDEALTQEAASQKGGDSSVSTQPVQNQTKQADPQAQADPKGAASSAVANQSIRVNVNLLENLMTMVSELVLTRNQLLQLLRDAEDSEFTVPLQRLNHVTSELQDSVMKTRMQPIGNAWSKLPRLVRDLALDLDKKIDLEMIGEDTELDRQVLELIKDPLTHMVRNSADHGLETTAERIAAGKSEKGQVTLKAYHEGGHINIEISDDGRGLNLEKIKQKAIENGLTSEAEAKSLTDRDIRRFIFMAGFSTATQVTNVSGRGVGMDVVRSNIEKIGGTIDLESTQGKGSKFIIKIPLTLAIVSALIVESAGERYAMPQIGVLELVQISDTSDQQVELINETPFLRLRERLLPLVSLQKLLKLEDYPAAQEQTQDAEQDKEQGEESAQNQTSQIQPQAQEQAQDSHAFLSDNEDESFVIVTQVGSYVFGIIVDQIFETQEIVVKPVSSILRHITVFSGNTILGDGSVVMILDPNGIVSCVGKGQVEDAEQDSDLEQSLMGKGGSQMALLIFKAGNDSPKAVPLALISRLEELEVSRIERANGQVLVQYRGALMPILMVDPSQQLQETGRQPVLVFSDRERFVGLAVDEIVDIVDEDLDVKIKNGSMGSFGSAVIGDQTMEVVDVDYFIRSACPDWFQDGTFAGNEGPSKTKKILFIDDSVFFRNLLTPYLNIDGYSVTAVSSAEEALELNEKGESFDVIICDIELEGMNGFEFAQKVRSTQSSWNQIPLVALSSHATAEDMERGREAGFTDYLAKHDRDSVLASLAQICAPSSDEECAA